MSTPALPPLPEGGCPCLYVEPCGYACSCAHPLMSGGCSRCCRYGSDEQRLSAAKRLAGRLEAPAPPPAKAETVKRLMRAYAIHYADYRNETGFENRDENLRRLAEVEDAIDALAAAPEAPAPAPPRVPLTEGRK